MLETLNRRDDPFAWDDRVGIYVPQAPHIWVPKGPSWRNPGVWPWDVPIEAASPVVEAVTTPDAFGTNASSWAVTLTGVTSGRLLVVSIGFDGGPAITTPSGWTIDSTGVSGPGGHCRHAFYYKVSDGTEGSSVTINKASGANQQAVARCYSISGHSVDPGTVDPTVAQADFGTAETTPDPPSANPGSSDDYLAIAAMIADGGAQATAYPSSYVSTATTQSAASDASNSVGGGWGHRQYTGTSEDPSAFTIDATEECLGVTMIIPPAAVGGGTANPFTMAAHDPFRGKVA